MKRIFPWVVPGAVFAIGIAAVFAARLVPPSVNISSDTVSSGTSLSTEPQIRLMFVGDIMLSRLVGKEIAASGDWRYPFLNIASTTSSADITFANLETTVSSRGHKIGSEFSFRSDPRALEGLPYAGIDVVSIANNHIWDYADDAFLDTQRHLREVGIAYAGGGSNYEEAHTAALLNAKGTRVAYLAYTNLLPKFFTRPASVPASASYDDWARVERDIVKAKQEADIVVVSYHWGTEYETHHNVEQEEIAKKTIDVGANLVIGSHPHVQQEIEQYKNGWIAYSLGNFVFDQYFQPEVMESRIFEVDLAGKTIVGAKVIPVDMGRQAQPKVSGEPIELK